ncbi:MAG: hypothetical protein ACQEP8_00260 [Chlamydiota bacterium]
MIYLIIASSLASIIGFVIISRWWRRFCLHRRFKRGARAEARAEKILRSYGYQVAGVQKSIRMVMYVNGRRLVYDVRPDAMAKKDGRLFLVEVKSGATATNPMYSHTRRQLLEYYSSFHADGVLLVDADKHHVHTIDFDGALIPRRRSFGPIFIAFLVGIGMAAVYFSMGNLWLK